MNTKQLVLNYFETNPIDDNSKNKYQDVMDKFGISLRVASVYWLLYKKSKCYKNIDLVRHSPMTDEDIRKYTGDECSIIKKSNKEVLTVEDVTKLCNIDPKKYDVVYWECSSRDVFKNESKERLYTVKAKFKQKKEVSLESQKNILLKELFNKSPLARTSYSNRNKTSERLLELCLFDVHFGKYSSLEEVGEEYSLKTAVRTWNEAINSLLSRVDLRNVDKFLLPIGQDLIHVDSNKNLTTAGTPQDVDGRYINIVRTVKDTIVQTVNMLSDIAPVDIIVVPANHDYQTTILLGDILEAYYHNNNSVFVQNNERSRKYYKFGVSSFMYTHGDKEKHSDLGMIFAAENPDLWASTSQRYIKIGHLHHNKVTTTTIQDLKGFQVQIIPSLGPNDAWHSKQGYVGQVRQAKAFLYSRLEGLIGEFTYTV